MWITINCGKFFKRSVKYRWFNWDWLNIGKEVHQGCILSPCLFKLYAENIMWNAGLDEAQPGIKIARRNINTVTKRVSRDTHAQCFKWSQLLHSHHLQYVGWKGLNTPSCLICFSLQDAATYIYRGRIKSVTSSADWKSDSALQLNCLEASTKHLVSLSSL